MLALLLMQAAAELPLPQAEPAPPPVIMARAPWPPPVHFINLPPPPTELPRSVRDLAAAAFDSRDDAALKAILKLARRTNPQAEAQIEAVQAEYAARRAEEAARQARERAEQLAAASLLENWKGEVELGGARSTGNTDSVSVYGAVRFDREGLRWRHLVTGRVDFQRSFGDTTADRWQLGWEPNYKIDDNLFVYGLAQYERDRFLGFSDRFTPSAGIGWTLIGTQATTLRVQGGPALRYTDYVDSGRRVTAAGRASMTFSWKVSPTLSLSQDAAVYLEPGNTNALATTTLETRLIGQLKARLSYALQYEQNNVTRREPLDTKSRATFVYSF